MSGRLPARATGASRNAALTGPRPRDVHRARVVGAAPGESRRVQARERVAQDPDARQVEFPRHLRPEPGAALRSIGHQRPQGPVHDPRPARPVVRLAPSRSEGAVQVRRDRDEAALGQRPDDMAEAKVVALLGRETWPGREVLLVDGAAVAVTPVGDNDQRMRAGGSGHADRAPDAYRQRAPRASVGQVGPGCTHAPPAPGRCGPRRGRRVP